MVPDVMPITGPGARTAARLCNFAPGQSGLLQAHVEWLEKAAAPLGSSNPRLLGGHHRLRELLGVYRTPCGKRCPQSAAIIWLLRVGASRCANKFYALIALKPRSTGRWKRSTTGKGPCGAPVWSGTHMVRKM
jgi:hypothetical protein